jgi:integrase
MAKKLTDIAVKNAKPRHRDGKAASTELPDGGCKGLYLVIQPTGAKSWAVRYRFQRRTRKLTLGSAVVVPGAVDGLTLAAARAKATEALHVLAKGVDPGAEKSKAKPTNAATDTFASIATQCFTREAKRLRSAALSLNRLQRLAFPALDKPIATIKRSDIVRLLDRIEDTRGPFAADATLSAISKVMHWWAARSDDYVPPLVRRGMRRISGRDRARDRILSDDELRVIWQTASDEAPFSALVKFLLLTAARRNEAAKMTRGELSSDTATWTLPAARNKTKQELVRPLSKAAQRVLAGLPRIADCDFVFTANGRGIYNNFAANKRDFDKRSGISGWRLHDLRRTARSLMSRAGVPDNHAEHCLGHIVAGVKGVYDRHKYHDEMLAAYEKLSALIERIVTPPREDSIVIELRR